MAGAAEGLIGWQARETLKAGDAMVFVLQALGADLLVEEGFVGQVGLGGFQRQVLVQRGNGWQFSGWAASTETLPGDQLWAVSRPSRQSYGSK